MKNILINTKHIQFLEKPYKLLNCIEKGEIHYLDNIIQYVISDKNILIISKQYETLVNKNLEDMRANALIKVIPQSINEGVLILAGAEVECAVLDDKRRIITQTALFKTFERPRKGLVRIDGLPSIIGGKNLAKFATEELLEKSKIIEYISTDGRIVTGYNAELIPLVCELYLDAEEFLTVKQLPQLKRAQVLIRSLAKIGITGLIDEATGYQYERELNALQKLFDGYISKELMKWSGIFPQKYYQEIFRLYNWEYDPTSNQRPSYVGTFTSKYIYEMLPPGILEELKRRTPKKTSKITSKSYNTNKYYQRLTETGIKEVESHIDRVIMLMEMCDDAEEFKNKFNKVFKDRLEELQKLKDETNPQLKLPLNI